MDVGYGSGYLPRGLEILSKDEYEEWLWEEEHPENHGAEVMEISDEDEAETNMVFMGINRPCMGRRRRSQDSCSRSDVMQGSGYGEEDD